MTVPRCIKTDHEGTHDNSVFFPADHRAPARCTPYRLLLSFTLTINFIIPSATGHDHDRLFGFPRATIVHFTAKLPSARFLAWCLWLPPPAPAPPSFSLDRSPSQCQTGATVFFLDQRCGKGQAYYQGVQPKAAENQTITGWFHSKLGLLAIYCAHQAKQHMVACRLSSPIITGAKQTRRVFARYGQLGPLSRFWRLAWTSEC